MIAWRWAAVVAATILFLPAPARAHPVPGSALVLDFERDAVAAETVMPLEELEIAFGKPLMPIASQVVAKYGDALRAYLIAHIHPMAPDGRPWTVEVRSLSIDTRQPTLDLTAHLLLRPPPGAPLRQFTLNDDAIVHEVISHKTFVFVRNDWNDARFASRDKLPPIPEAVGLIRYLVYSVEINRTGGSFWRGFASVFTIGMEHIAGGLDHLLFLLVLLLPAPLLPAGNRWGAFRGVGASFSQLLKIVTSFTVGHSLTLAIGALGWVHLPQRPVEIMIALTIVVSAVHAIRPIFAGWEPLLAGTFGLVHGLAFSSAISQFGFTAWHMALTVLAFNLGIEAMQLIFVLATVPVLLLLSRSEQYQPARVGGAALAGVAALAWIAFSNQTVTVPR